MAQVSKLFWVFSHNEFFLIAKTNCHTHLTLIITATRTPHTLHHALPHAHTHTHLTHITATLTHTSHTSLPHTHTH